MPTRVIVYREGEKLFDQEGESCFVTVLQGDLAKGGLMSPKALLLPTALASFTCLLEAGPEIKSAMAKVLTAALLVMSDPKPPDPSSN